MIYGKFKVVIDGRNARTMPFINSYIVVRCWTSNGSPKLLVNIFQCAYVKIIVCTLHLWSSKILTMVCHFIGCYTTISSDVEMFHNNILEIIQELQSQVDIKDQKKNSIIHLKRCMGFKL